MNEVKRWEPEDTFLGYNMRPGSGGSFVLSHDYEKIEAEAQVLREEVAQLKQFNVTLSEENTRLFADWEKADQEVAALRASAVVREEKWKALRASISGDYFMGNEWELETLDELARLNGKVVSEGLLRRALYLMELAEVDGPTCRELRALLDEGMESQP